MFLFSINDCEQEARDVKWAINAVLINKLDSVNSWPHSELRIILNSIKFYELEYQICKKIATKI